MELPDFSHVNIFPLLDDVSFEKELSPRKL
jgi:hypothetical protein